MLTPKVYPRHGSGFFAYYDVAEVDAEIQRLTAERDGARMVVHQHERSLEALADAGWQPITTAPKDGTSMLVYDEGALLISQWVIVDDQDADPPHREGFWDHGFMDPPPTHWMPLPAAPPRAPEEP